MTKNTDRFRPSIGLVSVHGTNTRKIYQYLYNMCVILFILQETKSTVAGVNKQSTKFDVLMVNLHESKRISIDDDRSRKTSEEPAK